MLCESQTQRDACQLGFTHWFERDEQLNQHGVVRVLQATRLMPVPRRRELGAATIDTMRDVPRTWAQYMPR